MGNSEDRSSVVDHFQPTTDKKDIWAVFAHLLETDAFLNLGYSAWYQTHLLGSCQKRLVDVVLDALRAERDSLEGWVLDLGCGRGGPATRLAEVTGARVIGIDLVLENLKRARSLQQSQPASTEFAAGDGTKLPIRSKSCIACTAVDSVVYMPAKREVYAEISRILKTDGVFVITDLFRSENTSSDDAAVSQFTNAWAMPPLQRFRDCVEGIERAGLRVTHSKDLTPNSVSGFRKWTKLYRTVQHSPVERLLRHVLEWMDADPQIVDEQVQTAHKALPALEHRLIVGRKEP